MRKKHLFYFLLFIPILTLSQEWDEMIQLSASDYSFGSTQFGQSVDIHGEYAVVGANLESLDSNGENNMTAAGAVYIFKLENGVWTEKQKIVASDRMIRAQFGNNVVIGSDGQYIAISSGTVSDITGGVGAIYIFKLQGETWVEEQKLVASDGVAGNLLASESLDMFGNYLVAGSRSITDSNGENPLTSAGAVYVFKLENNVWIEQQKIVNSDRAAQDAFNRAVIDEEWIIVGAGGQDTDIEGNNSLSNAGAAYIFKLENESWIEKQKLVVSDRAAGDLFGGGGLAIHDGFVVIGAYNEDEDENGENFISNAGSAYIFRLEENIWTEHQKIIAIDRAANDGFARYGLDINENHIIVGAYNEDEDVDGNNTLSRAGSAYIYELNDDGLWDHTQKIVASDRAANDQFSFDIAINGKYLLISSNIKTFASNTVGSTYIFELDCSYIVSPEIASIAICSGESVILETMSEYHTVNWYDSLDAEIPVFTGTEFTTPQLFETTSYWVEAVDSPCASERVEVVVTVNPTPELIIENESLEICERTSAILTASSDGALNWYDSEEASEPIFTGPSYETPELTETTSFWVEAQSGEGCISERQEILVTILPLPVLEAETAYEICSGSEATLYANSPNNVIFWYANEDDTEYLYHGNLFVTEELTEDTTFWVEAYNLSTGCTSERVQVTITVSEAISAPTAQPTQEFQEGLTLADLEVEHTGTLTWYADAQLTQELPETTVVVVGTTYYVTQSSGACESSATEILVDNFLGNGNLNNEKFAYYPNPVKDILNFSGKELVKSVQVYDLSGKLILNQTSNSISRINLSTLPKGTYVVKATTDKGINTFKIVKN